MIEVKEDRERNYEINLNWNENKLNVDEEKMVKVSKRYSTRIRKPTVRLKW